MPEETREQRRARIARLKRDSSGSIEVEVPPDLNAEAHRERLLKEQTQPPKPTPPAEPAPAEEIPPDPPEQDEQARSDELRDAFLTVRGPEEKLAAVARLAWFQTHGQDCPDEKIPRPAEFYEWCEQTKDQKTADWLQKYLTQWGEGMHETDPSSPLSRFTDFIFYDTLSPLVEGWQNQPTPAEPFRPKNKASLPALNRSPDAEQLRLLEAPLVTYQPPSQQLMLDLPELTPNLAGRSWLLDLYDRSGGQSMRQGRGAPWDLRLFIGAMLHLKIEQRDGNPHALQFPTEKVIEWLHPDGWPNRARDWKKFPQALERLNTKLGAVYIEGLGRVQLIFVTVRPQKPTDPLVEFVLRIPKTAANGARIDWPTKLRYGNRSAILYRSYLSAVEFMHHSAHDGQPITEMIGKPLLNKDGKVRRGKGGKVLRSKTEFIPNPAQRYVRGLTEGELTEMIGMNPANRDHRRNTREAFERLDTDNAISLERDGKVWRIFGPSS